MTEIGTPAMDLMAAPARWCSGGSWHEFVEVNRFQMTGRLIPLDSG